MTRRLLIPPLLAAGLLALLLTALAAWRPVGAAPAAPCVNPGGSGGCYASIQAAIDAAAPGDVVDVAAGTYREHITMTEGVSIHGQGWGQTIIDGEYSQPHATVRMAPGLTSATVLSGVQVTGGGPGTITQNVFGGGIYVAYASPRVVNTFVNSCTARYGGGVYVYQGSPSFENVPVWNSRAERGGGFYFSGEGEPQVVGDPFVGTNGTVWWNNASMDGGGVYIDGVTVTLTGLRIMGNHANQGGGVYINSTPQRVTLLGNEISLNTTDASFGRGGGLRTYQASDLFMGLNRLAGNSAQYGAGAYLLQSGGLVAFNWFLDNQADSVGGGALVDGDTVDLRLASNWFEGNEASAGAAIGVDGGAAPVIDANTLVSNTAAALGGGVYIVSAAAPTLTNNFILHNTGSGGGAVGGIAVAEASAAIRNNTIADNAQVGIWLSGVNSPHTVDIHNNLITGNGGYGIENYASSSSDVTLDYNDVWANGGSYQNISAGAHDVSVAPLYVGGGPNLAAAYHITVTSPISEAGAPAWAPARDWDGDRRAGLDGTASMGADEVPSPERSLYLPLLLRA